MSHPRILVIPATTHGRTLLRTPSGVPPFPLLAGFHGYGQNAETMLAELDAIPGSDAWARASIQGLHRFYNVRTNTVVASWMTREDREHALADNAAYVLATLAALTEAGASGPIVAFGFSQGVAMAYRAALAIGARCRAVVALGGDVPPEIRTRDAPLPRVLHLRGTRDAIYGPATFDVDAAWLTTHAPGAIVGEVDAGHELTAEIRARIGEFLDDITVHTMQNSE